VVFGKDNAQAVVELELGEWNLERLWRRRKARTGDESD
jgi:hypothetical protein